MALHRQVRRSSVLSPFLVFIVPKLRLGINAGRGLQLNAISCRKFVGNIYTIVEIH
jgi:hypothetical protein